MSSNKHYKDIDFIRIFACVSVLLFHLNILKGGYLAVCTFLVLTAYLSCISAFKKEKFSLFSYYSNRLLKIYLPLVAMVFVTIGVMSLLPNMSWINLKPETTSVLLGYNNFWQLSTNLDYFARSINSPFTHLWYIGILLQFELVFPFIYLFLRKIGDKIHKAIPCVITSVLAIASGVYFYYTSKSADLMFTYYNTLPRLFSLFFGLALGFIHSYYKPLKIDMGKKIVNRVIFYIYVIVLLALFIFVDSASPYFALSMIAVTLISCRLITYGVSFIKEELNVCDKVIKKLAIFCYEIYLWQYPVIYLSQYVKINIILKVPLVIIVTLIIAGISHYAFDFNNKNKKSNIVKYALCAIIAAFSMYGAYQYCMTIDYTREMKQLEELLNENEKMMQAKQEEYAAALKEEEMVWQESIKDLEISEEELKNKVTNLPIVGVGDSVMLGAVDNLYKAFPKGYFDAKVSRSIWAAKDILEDLSDKKVLGDPVVINLGANGGCSEACKKEILDKCGDREVFWLTVTNDENVHVNAKFKALAEKYKNLHIIDWETISKGHSEYFYSDGIHLNPVGRKAYTKAIYDSIYDTYLKKYQIKKDELIKEHEDKLKNKISYYGNDLVLSAFDYLHKDAPDARFEVNKDYNYETLKAKISDDVKNNALTKQVVIAVDTTLNLSAKEYEELVDLCKDSKVYIVLTKKESVNSIIIAKENVEIINFYEEIKNNDDYLRIDGIHLTDEGNKALSAKINEIVGK